MKKVLGYILAAVMVFSIAGCGSSSEETEAAGTEISAEAGESQMGESLMPGSEEASAVAEGEQAEEGEAAEGEADGEAAEGEAVEGEAAEGGGRAALGLRGDVQRGVGLRAYHLAQASAVSSPRPFS